MKRTTKIWLSAFLVAGIISSQPLLLLAQSNELEKSVQQSSAHSAITNTVAEIHGEAAGGTNGSTAAGENQSSQRRRGPVVSIGGRAELKEGESAEVVVAIGGSAKAGGKVQNAVVAIGGDAEADADVGDAVVAIGGNVTTKGKVGDAVVAVAGNAEVQGEVGDAVVAIMGDIKIGPGGVVSGDVVSVGGKIDVAKGAKINGEIVEVSVAQYPILAPIKGVADWLRHCLLKFRLLAPQPGWYWVAVAAFLLLYMLIAVAIPRPVAACVNELSQRPATTFLLGLLTKVLLPLVLLVLAMTGIGMLVAPFVLAALFVAALIGKVALFEYLGQKILSLFGVTIPRPALALLAGFVLITLLYMVPLLSLLVFALVGLWATGVAVTTAFSSARRETPQRPKSTSTGFAPTATPPPGAPGFAAMPAATEASDSSMASASATSTPPPSATVPEALALHRANFFERMGAIFLDVVVVSVLMVMIHALPPLRSLRPMPFGFFVALAYFAGMWAWKGTTIGGTVLGLKVVRLDDKPVTISVALVRGLASALSFIVMFLGFFWMIWDSEKQTWHDKIAGTVVVRSPRVMPLVCL